MTTEEKILLLSSCYSLSPDQVQTFRELVSQVPDWKQILDASRFHSLAILLVKHLSGTELKNNLSYSSREKLSGIARLHTFRRLLIISVFQELSSVFKSYNIEFILLKGLFLSDNLYADPGLRPMQDIDLLIRKDDLELVVKIMSNLGATSLVELQSDYINSFLPHIPPFHYKEAIIEIHTSPVGSNESYIFMQDTIWSNTLQIEIQKFTTRVFCPELNLIYLSVHAYRHVRTAKFRLIWFTDLVQMLSHASSFDPIKLNKLIRETRSEKALKHVFFLLKQYWTVEIGDWLPFITEDPGKRLHQNFIAGILRMQAPDAHYDYEIWKQIPGIKNKFKYLLGVIIPSVEYMKKKYKLSHSLPLIAIYPYNAVRVLLKGIRLLLT